MQLSAEALAAELNRTVLQLYSRRVSWLLKYNQVTVPNVFQTTFCWVLTK
jgi:hypothetical protein